MSLPHSLLAIIVVIIWGLNFIFVKLALTEMTPFVLLAARFLLAGIPAIFFIRLSSLPLRTVLSYGFITFTLQFSLIFTSLKIGMPAGLGSLLSQVQVFFSLFFAAILLREFPTRIQVTGALISFSGILFVASHFGENIPIMSLILLLAGAASWGLGNVITKKTEKINMIGLIAWSSFFASFPMIILSILIDGIPNIIASYHHLTLTGIFSLLYIVYASTWIGYGVWNWLLTQYPVSYVTPFTLLVPIAGMVGAVILLNEPMQEWKIIGGCLVLTGLIINLFAGRLYGKFKIRATPKIDQKPN